MDRKMLSLAGALAAAVGAASLVAPAASAADQEACYGISLKGHNDCAAGVHDCAGKSSADYSAADFKLVPNGSCSKMNVHGHKGSTTAS